MTRDTDERFPLLRNRLKDRMRSHQVSLCLRATLPSISELAFVADAAGFDALYVDLEHSTASRADAARLCTTSTALGMTALVRLSTVDDDAAVTLLDAGCQGLIAPRVETAADAQHLVDRCLFPPLGRRASYGPALLLSYQAVPPAEQAERLNGAVLLCVMLESARAVAAAGEIAAVAGIDLLLVGTQDLTADLGIPGAVDDPAVAEMYGQVAAAAIANGKGFGVAGVTDVDVLARYVALGAVFVSAGSDLDLLRSAAAQRMAQLRQSLNP